MSINDLTTWNGKPIAQCSREELIEAIQSIHSSLHGRTMQEPLRILPGPSGSLRKSEA